MTLNELGFEYLHEAKAVRTRIKELRRGVNEKKLKRNKAFEDRLYALYIAANDAEKTGKYLINYYTGGDYYEI